MNTDFNKLSDLQYVKSSKYRFTKSPDSFSMGYNQSSSWVSDLLYYCITKQKHQQQDLDNEFKQLIEKKRSVIMKLGHSLYRQGLLSALDDAY